MFATHGAVERIEVGCEGIRDLPILSRLPCIWDHVCGVSIALGKGPYRLYRYAQWTRQASELVRAVTSRHVYNNGSHDAV
jgi:hypothetical protein